MGCILVNYRSPWKMLTRCLNSIIGSTGGISCSIILVDNASGDGVPEQVRSEYPEVSVIELERNYGFAKAVNHALMRTSEPNVLLLNTDAILTAGALELMINALESAGEDCAGVAPKMMSSSHEGIIDAIGTVMPPTGASFNRGIGQCDLGQYDNSENVAGVCFGATLLRRNLFEPEKVGALYEGYFLYFEDSDWCMRAFGQGYRFITVPEAVVLHMHSGITRHASLEFKYGLIELNTLMVVTRTFESRLKTARIVLSRATRLLARTLIRRRFVLANLKGMSRYLSVLPRLLRERRELRRRRIVGDSEIFRMAAGEDAFFDTVTYQPDRRLDSLISTYLRLQRQRRDDEYARILAALYRLKENMTEGLEAVFEEQPPCVREMLDSVTADLKTL